jgi:hypothetical protein
MGDLIFREKTFFWLSGSLLIPVLRFQGLYGFFSHLSVTFGVYRLYFNRRIACIRIRRDNYDEKDIRTIVHDGDSICASL